MGTTGFFEIVPDARRLEIGYTWYAKSFQGTHVNTNCKYLLLEYVFEKLQANTVVLRTDIFNFKSQRAIERLGAKKMEFYVVIFLDRMVLCVIPLFTP